MEKYGYRFSFGPWNIHEGADPFGPPVRPARDFDWKLAIFKELDFDAVQFHDDDAVPAYYGYPPRPYIVLGYLDATTAPVPRSRMSPNLASPPGATFAQWRE